MRCLALLIVASCASDPGVPAEQADLVVGVQEGDGVASVLSTVHVVTTLDGAPVDERTVAASALPLEIPVKGRPGAALVVSVDGSPIVRKETTTLVAGGRRLLRIVLDAACAGGGCPPQTLAPEQLEDYDPTWSAAPPDICRPARHGAPEVQLGEGQTDYTALVDGQELSMELGPQGGHHIWIAERMRNLRRTGSVTTISGVIVGDPSAVAPAAFVFTFDPDEGGFCKLSGLRFQLDAGATDLANDYKRFLGHELDVTVTIADSTKATASATRRVRIASKLICPDGTDDCNR